MRFASIEAMGPSTSLGTNGGRRSLTVRDAASQWTPEFQALREAMGFPPLR
jgi:hypothetical protein